MSKDIQLTNEERRHIISAYGIGCPVLPDKITYIKNEGACEISSLSIEVGACIKYSPSYSEFLQFDKFKMALKPLSQMSDEDALAVAKLATRYSEDIDYVAYRFEIQNRADTYLIITFRGACVKIDYKHDAVAFMTASNIYMPSMFMPVLNMQDIVDYLRAKHYALPYQGHSLFELGVAIEQNKI